MDDLKNKHTPVFTQTHHFNIQWHLTNNCQGKCRHCYMYDEPIHVSCLQNELPSQQVINLFDTIIEGAHKRNLRLSVQLTGGDPLLYDGFFGVLQYIFTRVHRVGAMGNPHLITPAVARQFKRLGVQTYQMSLEGPQKINDKNRGSGNFDLVLKSIQILNEHNVNSHIMMTLHHQNESSLESLMHIVADNDVSLFAFGRLCAYGEGKNLGNLGWTPQKYRSILLRYLEKAVELKQLGYRTHFGLKDNLFLLLYKDLGLIPSNEVHRMGCNVGHGVAVLPDGTLYACRRFPSPLGNITKNPFWDIIESDKFKWYCDYSKFTKCRECDLLLNCRGCPAVTFSCGKSFYDTDPQCWKNDEDLSDR